MFITCLMNLVNFIDLPDVCDEFKVIQLYFYEKPHLVCGVKQREYESQYKHRIILETFLSKHQLMAGRDYETISIYSELEKKIITMPPLELKNIYRVIGVGYCAINKNLHLFQMPQGYCEEYKQLGIKGPDTQFNNLIKKTLESNSYI